MIEVEDARIAGDDLLGHALDVREAEACTDRGDVLAEVVHALEHRVLAVEFDGQGHGPVDVLGRTGKALELSLDPLGHALVGDVELEGELRIEERHRGLPDRLVR